MEKQSNNFEIGLFIWQIVNIFVLIFIFYLLYKLFKFLKNKKQ